MYSRHKRPKSCKYDTYRLRSRYSQVEENLFGEPLKNKLMARSRSMETITHEDNVQQSEQPTTEQQPTLFTRRVGANHRPKHLCNREDVKRPERPRTALATMRHSGNSQHPEFERRSSGQGGHEPGIVNPFAHTQQPLVISRRDFEKIKQAARIVTASEREAQRREREEMRESAVKAASDRKAEFETMASFHHTPEETEMEKENRLRDHHLIERANDLKMEQVQEIKKLNQHIIQVKCHAIRDMQVEEKEKRLSEMAEADRHLEEEIERERKQAEDMEAARSTKTLDFNKEFRYGLDLQKAEIEAKKLVEKEKFEVELALRKNQEALLREEEMKEAEAKREKMVELQQQMMIDVEETRKRREVEAERIRKNEERILALQDARREAEIRKEEEGKKSKREREKDMMRMKAAVEKEQELKLKREELRLVRQQEDEDRKWRQRKLEIARMEAQRNDELRRVRTEQLRQREEIAAKSVERDKQYWEEVRDMWQQSVQQDKSNLEMRSKAKREYLSALQSQMAEKHQSKINHQDELKDDSVLQETDRKTHQSRIQQLREKKLQQLR